MLVSLFSWSRIEGLFLSIFMPVAFYSITSSKWKTEFKKKETCRNPTLTLDLQYYQSLVYFCFAQLCIILSLLYTINKSFLKYFYYEYLTFLTLEHFCFARYLIVCGSKKFVLSFFLLRKKRGYRLFPILGQSQHWILFVFVISFLRTHLIFS